MPVSPVVLAICALCAKELELHHMQFLTVPARTPARLDPAASGIWAKALQLPPHPAKRKAERDIDESVHQTQQIFKIEPGATYQIELVLSAPSKVTVNAQSSGSAIAPDMALSFNRIMLGSPSSSMLPSDRAEVTTSVIVATPGKLEISLCSSAPGPINITLYIIYAAANSRSSR